MHQLHGNPENQFIHFFVTNHIVIKKTSKNQMSGMHSAKHSENIPCPMKEGQMEN